ncbi:peptidylprolyl isomerase [Fusibacter paucivorans]|uniref:Peptidylprolyl isomerase n=1 Tax=Fusibacter paucivorans TaxID=76009 RepID=A0ABS5PP13_9FIRM|nr:peptidylprolyl isomerase [Fusibacter paucivorans]MBS7526114.1 peptidylprolyl isomerase [Fusibacter paucivorans]
MSDKVLAKVNGRAITENDLNMFFQTLGQQVQSQFQGDEGMKRLLDELVYQELFYAEAVDTKLEETEAFKVELNQAKENLLKQFNIKNLIEGVAVTDDEATAFYEANTQYFASGEQVKASHILVDTLEKANEVQEALKGDLSFEEAAKTYSSCPSKENGGDLGFFQKGQMVPEFEAAAFEMATDTVSEPVQTQFGFHIIKKTGYTEAAVQSFDAVAAQIKQQLLIQKQNATYLEKVEALKSKYTVEML